MPVPVALSSFVLQNDGAKIAACLQIPIDMSLTNALRTMRVKMRGEIERDGGGLEVYTTNVNIAQGRQEYAEFAQAMKSPAMTA